MLVICFYLCFFQLCISSSQERQRLETILSLCSELGQADRDGGGATVADLQKINQELEKLQVNDEDDDDEDDDGVLPVFLDSPSAGGTNGHAAPGGLENGYCGDVRMTSRRPSETSLASLRGFAPSPSPRLLRNPEARSVSVSLCLELASKTERICSLFFFLLRTTSEESVRMHILLTHQLEDIYSLFIRLEPGPSVTF